MNAERIKALEDALLSTLNFIENTESEMGVILGCGDKARAALAASKPAPECHQQGLVTADGGQAAQPVTVQDAARRILSDDIAISHMAQALHDGPLGADDHWFSAARPQGAWCVDAVRVVLRAISERHASRRECSGHERHNHPDRLPNS